MNELVNKFKISSVGSGLVRRHCNMEASVTETRYYFSFVKFSNDDKEIAQVDYSLEQIDMLPFE